MSYKYTDYLRENARHYALVRGAMGASIGALLGVTGGAILDGSTMATLFERSHSQTQISTNREPQAMPNKTEDEFLKYWIIGGAVGSIAGAAVGVFFGYREGIDRMLSLKLPPLQRQ